MNNSRLVYVLQALSKSELKTLKKFVASPLYNQREDVVLLLDYLSKHLSPDKRKAREKQVVFAKVFPKQAYNEDKISYAMSYLFKLLKQFLAWQNWQNSTVHQQFHLVQSLRKKSLDKQFLSEWNVAIQQLNKQPFKSHEFHYQHFQLKLEKYTFNAGKTRKDQEEFQQYADELTQYFIIQQLRQSCFSFSHRTIANKTEQQNLQEPVLQLVEQNNYSHSPAIQVYYYCYKMLSSTDDTLPFFHTLKQLLKKHHHLFPLAELKDIYLLKINFCIKKINTGQSDFFKKIFEIYKDGLDLGIFLENGHLSRFTYKNITSTALHLNEFEWVKTFLVTYKEKIEHPYRTSAFHFNMAVLCYRLKDYDHVLHHLQKADSDDILNNCSVRHILLRTYYEIQEFTTLLSLLDSFKNYIYRHRKQIGYHQKSYTNLIRFTKKLIKSQYNLAAQNKLRENIQATKFVADKNWLLEQLSHLK